MLAAGWELRHVLVLLENVSHFGTMVQNVTVLTQWLSSTRASAPADPGRYVGFYDKVLKATNKYFDHILLLKTVTTPVRLRGGDLGFTLRRERQDHTAEDRIATFVKYLSVTEK